MALNVETLLAQQSQYGEEIQRIVNNYKKDPLDRKTKSYYEERLRRLETIWDKFDSNDTQIRSQPDPPLDHPYFSKGYYEAMQAAYEQYRDLFSQKIRPSETAIKEPNAAQGTAEARLQSEEHSGIASTPIKIMRRQRGLKDSLHRLLNSLVQDEQQPRQYYEFKMKAINQLWSQIESQNYAIWEASDNPSQEGYDVNEYIQLEERVQQCLIHLGTKLDNLSVGPASEQPNIGSTLKLPKITLPKFDGDYSKWTQFKDLFIQMVHKQPMADCQKLWYLKANVTGEAEKLIRYLPVSSENYNSAWKILQDRYDNKRLLVAVLINKLLSQPSHASENSSQGAIKALHDVTKECLMGLENLSISISSWDPLLLHLLVKKLDKTTHTLYEQSLENPRELQTIDHFLAFLETRFQSLEALGSRARAGDDQIRRQALRSLTTVIAPCVACKSHHPLFACKQFLDMSPNERLALLKRRNLCTNCMKPGHSNVKCSLRGCTKCSKKHNTLVHTEEPRKVKRPVDRQPETTAQPLKTSQSSGNEQLVSLTALTNQPQQNYVLLSTAIIRLVGTNGRHVECRAVLDSGSQINIVTERVIRKLGVATSLNPMYIQGIGRERQTAHKRASLFLQSRLNGFSERLEAHVLPTIISPQPTQAIDISRWRIPKNIKLADPNFNQPQSVDVLLGAEFYHQLLTIGQIKLAEGLPTLQNTVFGWIIAGKIAEVKVLTATCGICSEEDEIHQAIERFWKLEEIERVQPMLTPAEKKCEAHFAQTTLRNPNGRFIVRLPFAEDPTQLGESKDMALRRFLALERRLGQNIDLKRQYVEFMEEYLKLNHMEEINSQNIKTPHYFLPHHHVLKPDSSSTKLRVVFDASAKSSSQLSLNNVLHAGPTIQSDLFSILLRFRMPRFVFTADIQKMYRQILIHEDDRQYQLILWRSDPSLPIKCYQLNTVTYGTTAAPYLATKCLQKLAQERVTTYPLGSQVLERDFYVDDVMTGSNSLSDAIETQKQLISLLQEAGFKLRKWCGNNPRLLQFIPPEDQEVQLDFSRETEEKIKTLGLIWLPKTDQFCVKSNWEHQRKITKRSITSDIARLFDPLGILAPVIVSAKILLQQLWQLKVDWDAALPMEVHTKWNQFRENLKTLDNVQFPRHVFAHEIPTAQQIHTFADASEQAYGAAVYIRSVMKNGVIVVRLLCAKSRVAPTKKLTLPRLELCAAKLAADLTDRVKGDLNLKDIETYLWTDSEIVLAWINSSSSTFHTFVANRIASIQELTHPQQWRHVGSKENPADVLSRGISPQKIASHHIWFYGPKFLHGSESIWPPPYQKKTECELERKRVTLSVTTTKPNQDLKDIIESIDHGNSFRKVQRVMAYILRFVQLTKRRKERSRIQNSLTTQELEEALKIIIKTIQREEFKDEIRQLSQDREISKTSSLLGLTPFLDQEGILRVGGRLEASCLPFDAKHQMVLPYNHYLTKFLMADIHKENLHVGPQALLAHMRQRFWPIKGKTIARSVVQHCIRCARAKPKMFTQVMGNLPSPRVQPARPFINSGVDFCGPVWIHYRIRGKKPLKSYIAVFCCFSTKAVHLELVSDLTTEAFLGALKRFVGRRGRCKSLFCDNATNFVGARNKLEELCETIYSEKARDVIQSKCSQRGIEFHFIPPRAPHFGGLWEAAVKSAKYLLKRSLTSASLTYEEMETVIVEIEAILNSRPITPLSTDPNDLTSLTPGHFLIGEPLTAIVDPNAGPLKVSSLTRWKLVSHIKHEFWRRWTTEYLNELQHRSKWKQTCQNAEPGTMVVLKEDNVPVLKWPLGRIVQTYKGNDGNVRVADVRTAAGIIRRPIHKLSPLPLESDHMQELPLSEDTCKAISPSTKEDENKGNETDTTPSTNSAIPRKRARGRYGSAIVTLLIACIVLPAVRTSPIQIEKFSAQPGLYFDNMGKTNLISTEWNLVVYYDLKPYWIEFDSLQKGIQALQHLCQQMKQKGHCNPIITQFQHLQSELTTDNELLTARNAAGRYKRGALNIVGNVANSLFGILDSDYAEQMSKTIDNIKNNEEHLLTLFKNQTSVVDSTLNIIKRDQTAVEEKFHALDDQFTQLINRIHDTGRELYQVKIFQLFTSLSLQLTLISSNLQRIQAAIIDVITDIHHGKINPLLLAPHQLKKELATIKGHLSPSYRLPIDQDDISSLYTLMTARSRISNYHIIFQLKLPLLTLEIFDLFRIIPIPAVVNDTLIAIEPSSTLLAINSHRDHYYPLTEQELLLCSVMKGNNYLCNQLHPVYRKGSTVCMCEINLFNHSPVTEVCKIRGVDNSPIWIQLSDRNKWIYAVKAQTPTNAVCGDEAFPLTLEGSGLLKLQSHCIIKQDLITLQGYHVYPSYSRTSYAKLGVQFNFTKLKETSFSSQEVVHYKAHIHEIDQLKKEIASNNILALPGRVEANTTHHLSISYFGLILTVGTIMWLSWKFNRKLQKCHCHSNDRRKQPEPSKEHGEEQHDFSVHI